MIALPKPEPLRGASPVNDEVEVGFDERFEALVLDDVPNFSSTVPVVVVGELVGASEP